MSERRKYPRHRTLKAGRIVFNHRFSVISCTVRNVSEGGACLQVASSVGIPDCFDLTIEPEGASRTCNVAWRCEQRLHQRWQRMAAHGKPRQKIVVACARELAGFVWAIATDQPLRTI